MPPPAAQEEEVLPDNANFAKPPQQQTPPSTTTATQQKTPIATTSQAPPPASSPHFNEWRTQFEQQQHQQQQQQYYRSSSPDTAIFNPLRQSYGSASTRSSMETALSQQRRDSPGSIMNVDDYPDQPDFGQGDYSPVVTDDDHVAQKNSSQEQIPEQLRNLDQSPDPDQKMTTPSIGPWRSPSAEELDDAIDRLHSPDSIYNVVPRTAGRPRQLRRETRSRSEPSVPQIPPRTDSLRIDDSDSAPSPSISKEPKYMNGGGDGKSEKRNKILPDNFPRIMRRLSIEVKSERTSPENGAIKSPPPFSNMDDHFNNNNGAAMPPNIRSKSSQSVPSTINSRPPVHQRLNSYDPYRPSRANMNNYYENLTLSDLGLQPGSFEPVHHPSRTSSTSDLSTHNGYGPYTSISANASTTAHSGTSAGRQGKRAVARLLRAEEDNRERREMGKERARERAREKERVRARQEELLEQAKEVYRVREREREIEEERHRRKFDREREEMLERQRYERDRIELLERQRRERVEFERKMKNLNNNNNANNTSSNSSSHNGPSSWSSQNLHPSNHHEGYFPRYRDPDTLRDQESDRQRFAAGALPPPDPISNDSSSRSPSRSLSYSDGRSSFETDGTSIGSFSSGRLSQLATHGSPAANRPRGNRAYSHGAQGTQASQSQYDLSSLSAKEIAKLERKGINPTLYLEMKAAREKGKGGKGFWHSPLAGGAFI